MPENDASRPEGRDFIRDIVARDVAAGTHAGRVATRFPPEPNGFLHVGHAKSICLNFGIALEHGGTCNLRFDDTNPTTEDVTYVEAIKQDVHWLGFDWSGLFHASDYFEQLHDYAVVLIRKQKAYVDSSSEEEIRRDRGTVTEPGRPSPYRDRSVEENLDLFRRMRAGEFPDGSHVLRAKIDLSSPNMIMRDPILYRIRHAHHYRTGEDWCIYPLYDFAHCLSDSIEGITHSICTLEFENNRELYDWILDEVGVPQPQPRQYEFARLNLEYTVLSKRKLLRLVNEGHVSGWDDPRMPTISGVRRRGVTPEALRSFCDLIGVAKADSRVDIGKLEYAIRDDLNRRVPRVMCVLRPLKVVIENFPEGEVEELDAPLYPHDVPLEGSRRVPFTRELYIERDDFMEYPPTSFHRLSPGREVRLRYGYFVRCVDVVKDTGTGEVVELRCKYDPETRGGSAPDGRKVKGTIHWVSAERSVPCEVRLYDRLFSVSDPDDVPDGEDFTANLNPDSLEVITDARVEPAVEADRPGSRYQFERLGYFYSDPDDSAPGALVFNRTVTLRDTWEKIRRQEEERRHAPKEAVDTAPASGPMDGRAREAEGQSEDGDSPGLSSARERARSLYPGLAARFERYQEELGLTEVDAGILTGDLTVAELFDDVLAEGADPEPAAKWMINEVLPAARDRDLADLPFGPEEVADLLSMMKSGEVSTRLAREVFREVARRGGDPREIVRARARDEVSDPAALAPIVDRLVGAHPDKAEAYRNGREGLLGFFVGQVMRETGGKADPRIVQEIVRERLG